MATADDRDPDHHICRALLEAHSGPLVTTALVVTETGWLIRRQHDTHAEVAFYAAIGAGEITVENLDDTDWTRISELVATYANLGLDAADASIIAIAERFGQTTIAERFGQTTIATLDHRDFRVVRPTHCDAFQLVPTLAP